MLDVGVVGDYAIVDQIVSLGLVIVRMRIPAGLAAAGRPTRMRDPQRRNSSLAEHFFDHSVDAV